MEVRILGLGDAQKKIPGEYRDVLLTKIAKINAYEKSSNPGTD